MKNDRVFRLLQKIPGGKVTTYQLLAKKAELKSPREVGRIIHQNTDPARYPCHRVVRSDGTIADGYAFGGKKEQIKKLKDEGIVIENGKIDLQKFLAK